MQILVGDVGGTNCRFATWTPTDGLRDIAVWPTATVGTLAAGVAAYQQQYPHARPDAACIAVAGPVAPGGASARLTNADWSGASSDLPGAAGGVLINDLHAAARGLTLLSGATDWVPLGGPRAGQGDIAAVMGVGTGLGQALLVGDRVVPGEGGHVGFAPADAVQERLLRWLLGQVDRVSLETVAAGPGLGRLLRFFVEAEGMTLSAAAREARTTLSDEAVVLRFAAEDAACAAALGVFLQIIGSAAGDLALRCLPRRGVFLCGGVLPRALAAVQDGRLRAAFMDKAPMTALLREVPCALVTHPQLGLLGAAAEARRMLLA